MYLFIGEDYQIAGDLAEANRWLNLGLHRLLAAASDGAEGLSGFQPALLLGSRRRVRQELGFPPDEFDERSLLPPTPE